MNHKVSFTTSACMHRIKRGVDTYRMGGTRELRIRALDLRGNREANPSQACRITLRKVGPCLDCLKISSFFTLFPSHQFLDVCMEH